jgi:drug/metabolite transporter (DMT)-like permease
MLAMLVLFSAFCYALGSVLTKELVRTESPDLVVLHMNVFGVLFFAIPTYLYWVPPTNEDWLLLVALGAVTMCAHICYTHGMAAADAGYLFAFEFLRLPLAALAGLVLFAEVPDIWTGAGALIIFGATYYIIRRERNVKSAAANNEK